MKAICPYCGKQQDESNTLCQFCGAGLGGGAAAGPEREGKEAEAATGLCSMCMRSFAVEELTDHEGALMCKECLKKVKQRETALAPAMRKSAPAEEPVRKPGRKLASIMVFGVILAAGLSFGVYQLWGAVRRSKRSMVDAAAKSLKPVIEKNNEAVALLHQHEGETVPAGDAVKLLVEALAEVTGEPVQAACGADEALEDYRLGVKDILGKRLTAARTLAGQKRPGDPATAELAREMVVETDSAATETVAALVARLRLWHISAEPFLLY